jgi:hypothetical protein
MNVALIVVASVLVVGSVASGVGKLTRQAPIVEVLTRVGVAPARIPLLGTLQILGALGVVVGIWMPVLGMLATLCLTLYYLGAMFSHLRIKDTAAGTAPATALFVVALVTTVLETAR